MLKKELGDSALAIFVKVPSVEILETSLRSRSTEYEKTLKMRIDKAAQEMKERVSQLMGGQAIECLLR